MAMSIKPEKKGDNMQKMHTLKERTNVTLDGKKLQGAELSGKFLGNAGDRIPLEDAIALGLVDEAEEKEAEEAEDKSGAPAENKGKKKK